MVKVREQYSFLKTVVSLILIVLCLTAANWQYHRGVDRHARNTVIENRISLPAIELKDIVASPIDHEWQSVRATGNFDTAQQILLRNRYSEGIYGLEVLTLFTARTGEKFWVDRGWVKAGATATTPPKITPLPSSQVEIRGRLRLDTSLPRGSFFAFPANGKGLISKLNAQSQLDTQNFYFDLLEGSEPTLTPAVPAALPELTDGPHMAYALQWLFFAGLVIYGRFLIRRSS
jgi:surfeit locus 1 family protein